MNIIAVDDENLALKSIERAIRGALPDTPLSCFAAPSEALLFAQENQIDVAFLDVEMGGMNGLELAKRLKDIRGRTNIIFVTGYLQYAADSYSVGASDYIMKPVAEKDIVSAMENLRNPIVVPSKNRVRIRTFGNFEVFVDGKPLVFARSKTKELFAYLISRNGALCSNNEISAVIWEDQEDSASMQSNFRNLVADLIKTLGAAGVSDVLIKHRGTLGVLPENISCDMFDFLKYKSQAVNLYRGEFMAQYSWAELGNAYWGQHT